MKILIFIIPDGKKYIGWNKALLDKIFHPIVSDITKTLDFELFHLTHITNLKPISDQGLKCHNDISGNKDISNEDISNPKDLRFKFGEILQKSLRSLQEVLKKSLRSP